MYFFQSVYPRKSDTETGTGPIILDLTVPPSVRERVDGILKEIGPSGMGQFWDMSERSLLTALVAAAEEAGIPENKTGALVKGSLIMEMNEPGTLDRCFTAIKNASGKNVPAVNNYCAFASDGCAGEIICGLYIRISQRKKEGPCPQKDNSDISGT